jgi:hypothetical protein
MYLDDIYKGRDAFSETPAHKDAGDVTASATNLVADDTR